jgi:hypothetical protein
VYNGSELSFSDIVSGSRHVIACAEISTSWLLYGWGWNGKAQIHSEGEDIIYEPLLIDNKEVRFSDENQLKTFKIIAGHWSSFWIA